MEMRKGFYKEIIWVHFTAVFEGHGGDTSACHEYFPVHGAETFQNDRLGVRKSSMEPPTTYMSESFYIDVLVL